MEDGGKQPFGSGQQRNQHPRPFFYVQPPSQPYFLYQHWQLNNPYSHYGLPGGLSFGRPSMHPYLYMQYPGFVFPHAPVYPVDHRRVFEPRFHAPTWGDMPRQQHYPQPRRETACSEAQTDPSDTIIKLIECLDKIRELDSGVTSQSSGIFSPGEEKKSDEEDVMPSAPDGGHLESLIMTCCDSTTAVYDADSSQRSLGALSSQGCWSGGLEEELPLDSSSVQEECSKQPVEVHDIQTDTTVTEPYAPKCDTAEELLGPVPPSTSTFNQPAQTDAQSGDKVSKTEHQKADRDYQILKLPFESALTSGDAAASHYYNYFSMRTTHERMSVLSPSLDELSSREEMFSTDLDDVDLFPKRVYAGRRFVEVVNGSPQAPKEVEEAWLQGSKRSVCACCGKSLTKVMSRSKGHKMYWDEGGDSDEDSRYGKGCDQPVRVVVRKHLVPWKPHSIPPWHVAKPGYKRGQYKDPTDPLNQEEGPDLKSETADGEATEANNGLCRDGVPTSEQGRWGDGDVIPRRRQAALPQRQEMGAQRKVMYHRPRDEDDDAPPLPHWERATSTMQQSYGLGPRGLNPPQGAQQAQGPLQSSNGPSGAPRSEEQHHKPFFYVQPPQSYLPMQSLQWPVSLPMPVSYNPYFGYPGFGYGMSMMPNYQPVPFMEPPGFVVPHTHLHLMDYRRMLNPQYYQSMAYHSRRFRYQHNSQTREMTSSEVQTEPLSTFQRTSTPSSSEASSGLQLCSSDHISSPSTSQLISAAMAVQKGDHSLELNDTVPSSTTRTPPNGSFVIQTEEVRIECHTTPEGLQLLHSHETAEVSHSFSQDVVQRSSLIQDCEKNKGSILPKNQAAQAIRSCPDILLVGTPNNGEKIPALDEEPVVTVNPNAAHRAVQDTHSKKDMTNSEQCRVIKLPFDPKYLDELRKMESMVWSVEETLVPSPESLIQNDYTDSYDEKLVAVDEIPTADVLICEEAPTKEMKAPTGCGYPEMAEVDLCILSDAAGTGETTMTELTNITEAADTPYLLLLDPLKEVGHQDGEETVLQDHQDTSFESLPAYLPSTSWLADFENGHYCSKLSPAPNKPSRPVSRCRLDPPSRRRKLDLEYREHPAVRKPKERYKPKGKVDRRSLSDHECCLSRSYFNENSFTPFGSKRDRLCTRCLSKRSVCTSPGLGFTGQTLKRKAVPFEKRNDPPLPTCEACKCHPKKRLMKTSSPEVRTCRHGQDPEGESSENGSCHTRAKCRAANGLKRPLASKQNVVTCPTGVYPKVREKNCVCSELPCQPVSWERMCRRPHSNAIQETDENSAMLLPLQEKWRHVDQIYLTHPYQTEKPWKASMPKFDIDGSKKEARSQHTNKHKKSQPRSQGTCRKDTRC